MDEQTPKSTERPFASSGLFTKEQLRKKFRLSEFLSEKIITMVAFFTIAIIVLIFLFVFREALPLFHTEKAAIVEKARLEEASGRAEDEVAGSPETYVPGAADENNGAESTGGRPETYDPAEPEGLDAGQQPAAAGPERYDPDAAADISQDAGRPEIYDPAATSEAEENMASVSQAEGRPFDEEALRHYENRQALKTLNTTTWQPVSDAPRYGLWPLFLGTLKITLIAILFAAPIAILAALFAASFAPLWMREIIKPAVELLAGFPSVVVGFFAMMVLASFFQDIFGYSSRLNAFVGGIAMSLAAIPIIFTITEDALSSVPKTYTEASLALGASKWQTSFFVLLPAATPGIFASLLLGIGRVFGETMIALMATGNASMMTINPFDSVRTLSATIGAEMAEVVYGDTHYSVLFLIGALLFIFTFILNSVAEFYVRGRLMRKFMGRT